MIARVTAVLCLSGFLLFIACSKRSTDEVSAKGDHQVNQRVVNKASYIAKGKASRFAVDEFRLKDSATLRTVFFVDEINGWVAGGGKLYKTGDGGKSWEQIEIKVPQGADVEFIQFLNETVGWIVIQKRAPDVLKYQEAHFWLMQTNDAGQSWHLQYEDRDAEVTGFSISDQHDGWLAGIKYVGPARYTFLIVHTSDRGQHWMDVYADLKNTTSKTKNEVPDGIDGPIKTRPETNDGVMGLIPTGPLTATIITGTMQILRTSDGGRKWARIVTVTDKFDQQSVIRRLGTKGGYLWMVEATDSEEGTRGKLTIEQANSSWTRYILQGVYLADVVSLSGREFVSCGYVKRSEDRGEKINTFLEGAILHSADDGEHWTILYRNPQIKRINSLIALDSDHVWAVGDDGLILRLWSSAKESKNMTAN